MKGLRANIKKNNENDNRIINKENRLSYEQNRLNNSKNYNYDYDDCRSEKNREVFSSSQDKDRTRHDSKDYKKELVLSGGDNSFNFSGFSAKTPQQINHQKNSFQGIQSPNISTINTAKYNDDKNWVKRLDEENLYVQHDAQELIDQTQKLIDDMYKVNNKTNNESMSFSNKEKHFSPLRDSRGFNIPNSSKPHHKTFSKNSKMSLNTFQGKSNKDLSKRVINYEDAIRVKSRSPSPPTQEPRGVMSKFNNSMINSETNLKSKICDYFFI